MKTGGVTRRLVVFANALVGGMAGGLGMVAVVACIFFAGMTGSGLRRRGLGIPPDPFHGRIKLYERGMLPRCSLPREPSASSSRPASPW